MFIHQPSFAAGEIAPDLYGRVDQDLYYIGLRTCLNFIVRQYGGCTNRPGTKFTAESKDSTKKTRLIPFQFNEIQTYALAFSDNFFRVIKNGAEVLEANKTITGITQANPAVVTSAGHGFTTGDNVYIGNVVGMTQLNGRTFKITVLTANTFSLQDYSGANIDSSAYGAYSSGGIAARVYTVTTTISESRLFDMNYAQSNDVLTIVHPDFHPLDITRTAHDAWTVSNFNVAEGPFKDINTGATTVQASATSGTGITVTASSAIFTGADVGTLFYIEQTPNDTTRRWEVGKAVNSGDIRRAGSHFYQAQNTATTGSYRPDWTEGSATDGDNTVRWAYLHSGFGIVRITAIGGGGTTATCDVIKRLPDLVVSTTTTLWSKAAWSNTEGYPAACAYHKQRMIFGGNSQQPNALWMSGVAARTFFGKSNPILDDETIAIKLDTVEVNAIRHLLPLKQLIALTSASEQLISGVDGLLLATETPNTDVQGYTGASKVKPIIIGNTAVFVQDLGNVVRSLQYNLDSDTFTGIDLSARSPHLFENKTVVDWAYQRHPFSVIWTCMNDGSLYGFTYMQEQKVYAWHRHQTDGFVESVCSIREGNESAVYFVVRRTINGQTKRYYERLSTRFFKRIEDSYFVDCGLTYDGRNYTEDAAGNKTALTSTTMTVSGGTTWKSPEVLTITSSAAIFNSADVGNRITFWVGDVAYHLDITAFTSSTVVSAIPTKEIPVAYRNAAKTDWVFARKTFGPLHHIEGKAAAVLADGNVVEGLTVTNGLVTLPKPYGVVHIGLPYVADMETLDMSSPPPGETKAKTLNVPRVFITAKETRALSVGINGFENVRELKQREPSIGYDRAIPAETTIFEAQTNSMWSRTGRICIRQAKPLPMTITCVTPEVVLGYN